MSSKPSNKNAYAVEAVDPASLSKIRLRLSNRRGPTWSVAAEVAGYNDIVVLTVPVSLPTAGTRHSPSNPSSLPDDLVKRWAHRRI